MVKLRTKYAASTLIEALVAMVIIVFMSGISVMIFLNIDKSGYNRLRTEAIFQINNILIASKKDKIFIDEEYQLDNMIIKKSILPFERISNLKILQVEAQTKSGKFLLSKRELIDCSTGVIR